jgi:ubiquinone/menaquinone biosynthesis C-methylase UbiE
MATDFPSSKFYGINPVATFPGYVSPRNVEFIVANVLTDTLPFKDAEFDYVFARNLMFTFQKPNFESIVMKEILRVVKPGGYVEVIYL